MIGWLKQQYIDLLFKIFPLMPSYIAKAGYEEFDEKYKEFRVMTENTRLIHGSYGERRYLHSDEIFRKERNWNIHLPSEREFKDGYCIITDKDYTAYSIDELVELLNEFQKENKQLKATLRTYRKVANCKNCDYHDYDYIKEGDYFEICEKGNNVTEGICKEWREL